MAAALAGRDLPLHEIFYLAAASRKERIDLMERICTSTKHLVPQLVVDFSLYQAAVLNKSSTVIWLLRHCQPSADAGSPPTSLSCETQLKGLSSTGTF